MKVLIADDDPEQLAIRQMLLKHFGFEPIIAGDAQTALSAAITERPACAVVDLRLPSEKSGLGLIRDLKRVDERVHILVLTGGSATRLDSLAERSLVDAVIEKGSPSAQLIARLKAFEKGCR